MYSSVSELNLYNGARLPVVYVAALSLFQLRGAVGYIVGPVRNACLAQGDGIREV